MERWRASILAVFCLLCSSLPFSRSLSFPLFLSRSGAAGRWVVRIGRHDDAVEENREEELSRCGSGTASLSLSLSLSLSRSLSLSLTLSPTSYRVSLCPYECLRPGVRAHSVECTWEEGLSRCGGRGGATLSLAPFPCLALPVRMSVSGPALTLGGETCEETWHRERER